MGLPEVRLHPVSGGETKIREVVGRVPNGVRLAWAADVDICRPQDPKSF